jgi:TATA-box binding protein (TBP) (component of TFIID and TFIIIB)
MKIHNVITTANLRQYVDITKFIEYSWGEYDLERYGGRCGYVKDAKIQGRVTVFLSGKMISTGVRAYINLYNS